MLSIRLDDPVPIADQILAGVRRLIATSALKPGDDLPPVRQLAGDLGVNLNTVARAYRALENEGLVSTVRGRGTQITADRESANLSKAQRKRRIVTALGDVFADARLAGLTREDAAQLVDGLLDTYWPQLADERSSQ